MNEAVLPTMPDLGTMSGSPQLDAAWLSFWNDFAECRKVIFGNPFYDYSPQTRTQGHNLLFQMLSIAYQVVIEPRQLYPTVNHFALSPSTSWGGPSPDSAFQLIFLDGRESYRLWGQRNTVRHVTIGTYRGFPGDADSSQLGFYEVTRDFEVEPDGSFEIGLSADEQPGNWIRLDRDSSNNLVQFRQIHLDWDNEMPASFHVERVDIDEVKPNWEHGEDQLAERIARAGEMMLAQTRAMTGFLVYARGQVDGRVNTFFTIANADTANFQGGDYVEYIIATYELDEDEALIVEADAPVKSLYWNFQLLDIWAQNLGGTFFTQSSLNSEQIAFGTDGKIRLVIACKDPGVANWLDAFDNPVGMLSYRVYEAVRPPVPKITRVKLADLDKHLPTDTARMDPEQRKERLRARRRAAMQRWRV